MCEVRQSDETAGLCCKPGLDYVWYGRITARGTTMKQGDLALLNDPVARQLLNSAIPARLAYCWTDGAPRVVPIWFEWDGTHVVLGTPARAPKLRALRARPDVALTIDDNTFPTKYC